MKKILKNQYGFTLVEMLLAAGLSGIVGLIAYNNLKVSNEIGTRTQIGVEATYLKNLVISTMADPIACGNTFKTQNPNIVNPNVIIKDKYDKEILKSGKNINAEADKRTLFVVTKIQSAESTIAPNALVLTVEYELASGISKTVTTKTKNAFDVNVLITRNLAGDSIISCSVDMNQLLIDAVKGSCNAGAGGAHYELPDATYPYGRCLHDISFTNTSGVTTTLTSATPEADRKCPIGYFLVSATTPTAPGITQGITNFSCKKISTKPICDPGFYLKAVSGAGVATCEAISKSFPAGGINPSDVIVLTSSGYVGKNINCTENNKVLSRLNPVTGAPECIPKYVDKICPAGSYISYVDTNGDIQCRPAPTGTTCGAGQFVKKVYTNSAVECGTLTLTGACAANQAIRAIDANGTITACTTIP